MPESENDTEDQRQWDPQNAKPALLQRVFEGHTESPCVQEPLRAGKLE